MNKKSLLIAGVAVLVLSIASISLAGPMMGGGMMGMGQSMMGQGRMMGQGGMGGPGFQGQPAQLTDQQRADWKAWQEKNFQLRKEYVSNLVKSGMMTQEQADARLKAMDAGFAFRMKNGFVAPGSMMGAKLTDVQKADMKKLFDSRLSLRKDALNASVAAGQITQAQADNQLKWMQERFDTAMEKGFAGPMGGRGMGMGGGMRGGCSRS